MSETSGASFHQPEIAINQDGRTVADELSGHLKSLRAHMKEPPALDIATAYFNVNGFTLLADQLEELNHVRILLGAEPTDSQRVRRLKEHKDPDQRRKDRLSRALREHELDIARDRDLTGFSYEVENKTRRLINWLGNGAVEVRRLEDEFLHGKAWIERGYGGVLVGSSNFTYAGLAQNLELNLARYDPGVTQKVVSWFDALWERAEPYDLGAVYAARFEPYEPWLIYLRMLYERYGAEIEEEERGGGFSDLTLTSFQRDGLERARRILARHDGVIIADEVGLGKTFIAGELIREAVQDRRQRAIVVAPAALRDGPWRAFVKQYGLSSVEVCSFDDVVGGKLQFAPDEYAMVVVDEAHALRNPDTQRGDAMRQLLTGDVPKDIVFLTATPVNNSLWDLYNLLDYFVANDAAFLDLGIPSLRTHFTAAMAQDPEDLTSDHLFEILDAVVVRRTRRFVKDYYPNDTIKWDGRDVPIRFPEPEVKRVSYDLSDSFAGFFDRFTAALPGREDTKDDNAGPSLTLARYAPSAYLLKEDSFPYERQLVGLLRSGLLKRFESSSYAFAATCEKMASSHDHFLALLDQGKIATGTTLREWGATDSDDVAALQEFFDEHDEDLRNAGDFDVHALRRDVKADKDLLLEFAQRAQRVTRNEDPKLAQVVDQLAEIAVQARSAQSSDQEQRDKRKVLIFTYFADTVDWVFEHLDRVTQTDGRLSVYAGRVASTTGQSGGADSNIVWGFAPRTTDAPPNRSEDKYDILVTTDVLAEGVNLQQAGHIINYDLPWNPMRLVQRHGRIDRIGSSHERVFMHCVFPDRELDTLLRLEERLQTKIKQAAVSIGVADGVLPGTQGNEELVFADDEEDMQTVRAELAALSKEDSSLFRREGTRERRSGEELRKTLSSALVDENLAERMRALPFGAGSGFVRPGGEDGWVFCIRVADHNDPLFRFVRRQADGSKSVAGDTLMALAQARPYPDSNTPRVLPPHLADELYEAWDLARKDVYESWQYSTDPANFAPRVPKPLREAAELLKKHSPKDKDQTETDRRVGALESPHPVRIQRDFRRILNDAATRNESPKKTARRIHDRVKELGLRSGPPPEPLQPITEDDIHVLVWMAISSELDNAGK